MAIFHPQQKHTIWHAKIIPVPMAELPAKFLWKSVPHKQAGLKTPLQHWEQHLDSCLYSPAFSREWRESIWILKGCSNHFKCFYLPGPHQILNTNWKTDRRKRAIYTYVYSPLIRCSLLHSHDCGLCAQLLLAYSWCVDFLAHTSKLWMGVNTSPPEYIHQLQQLCRSCRG